MRAEMSDSLIDLRVEGGIATLTLNRPDKRNAMSDEMRSQFIDALERVAADKAIRALRKYDGIVEQATESELAEAAARADRTGMFNCPHTGVALAVLEKLIARDEVGRSDRVVVVSTAHGLKFAEFKVGYHTGRLTVGGKYANPPLELPNDFDAVRKAIDSVAQALS